MVSIPQAVSTVATMFSGWVKTATKCFNTASGKYCCNFGKNTNIKDEDGKVSIPQAVSTVATRNLKLKVVAQEAGFNTASGKYCCNS